MEIIAISTEIFTKAYIGDLLNDLFALLTSVVD